MKEFSVTTNTTCELIDITGHVRTLIRASGIASGMCLIFVPHTTAAVTINENADPDVTRDITMELNRIVPLDDGYRHYEGNAAAHIKATLVGASQAVIIDKGELVLGTWQSVFFCEFDGPRTRRVLVSIIPVRSES